MPTLLESATLAAMIPGMIPEQQLEKDLAEAGDDELERLAARLRYLRAKRGLSRPRLAELSGVGKETIKKWETAEREPGCLGLKALAAFYDVSVDELVGSPPRGAFVDSAMIRRLKACKKPGPQANRLVEEALNRPLPFHSGQEIPAGSEWVDRSKLSEVFLDLYRHVREIAPGVVEAWQDRHKARVEDPKGESSAERRP